MAQDARDDLLWALQLPAPERNRAVRRALMAWLAAGGAGAVAAVRDDPGFAGVAGQMMRLALHAYPEVFLDDPSLLEGVPDAEQKIRRAALALAVFDKDIARALIEEHLSGSIDAQQLLLAIDEREPAIDRALSAEDARAELESLLADPASIQRGPRVHHLFRLVAQDDPAAAAALIEDLPPSSASYLIDPLIDAWSQDSPEQAARWLAGRHPRLAQGWLNRLAELWAERDYEAASLFAENLTSGQRADFLSGVATAVARKPHNEALAWLSRYEGERAWPSLVRSVAGQLAHNDFDAALTLVETLPENRRLDAYAALLPAFHLRGPETAIDRIVEIDNEMGRNLLLTMATSVWAQLDTDAAMDWALDLQPGSTRNAAIATVATYLMHYDRDRAMDAVDQIDAPLARRAPVQQLLRIVDTDEEAILIGRDHGFDRDTVLKLREFPAGMRGPMPFVSRGHTAFINSSPAIAGRVFSEPDRPPDPDRD